MTFPRRGEVYFVGHEIKKTRPADVIQNDVSNQYSPITIVVAISSHFATPPHPVKFRSHQIQEWAIPNHPP